MLSGEEPTLSYGDLCTLLTTVANTVNERPIALVDNFTPLIMNQVLLGKTPEASMEPHDDLEKLCFGASNYQRVLLDTWWKWWKCHGFTSLLPYKRLKKDKTHANLAVGDVCLFNQDNDVCGTYKLCQVLQNKISTRGQMRTVKEGYEEDCSLAGRKNKSTPRKEIVVGVQRLELLMPTDKVDLLRMSANYDFELPGAYCPWLPSDTAE